MSELHVRIASLSSSGVLKTQDYHNVILQRLFPPIALVVGSNPIKDQILLIYIEFLHVTGLEQGVRFHF